MRSFVLSIWTSVAFIYALADAQGDPDPRFDPVLFVLNANSPQFLELPTTEIPSLNDPDVLRKVIATCPGETKEQNILAAISIKGRYCLFQRPFNPNEIISCTQEVKPMLHVQYDDITHKPTTCGTSEKYILYEFGFYYCGTRDVLIQLSDEKRKKTPLKYFKPRFFPIYELCINPSKHKALWTRHNVMTPAIFQENKNQKKLPFEMRKDLPEISVDDLPKMKSKHFTKLKTRFTRKQNQNQEMMKPTFMVPMEHIALRTWKTAASHFINVAPFLSTKEKLMTCINDGIKKVAFRLYAQNQHLSIYTAVRELTKKGAGAVWDHLQSKPNVWYKLLYSESSKLAAMIVIHSDLSGSPKFKACERPSMDCTSMSNWSNWSKKREGDIDPILQNYLAFAYCCEAPISDVEKIFNMYLEIRGVLDIDKAIQEYNQDQGKSNNPPMAVPYPAPAPGKAHPLPPSAPPLSSGSDDGIPIAQPYYAISDTTGANHSPPTPPLGYPTKNQSADSPTKVKKNQLREVMHSSD